MELNLSSPALRVCFLFPFDLFLVVYLVSALRTSCPVLRFELFFLLFNLISL